MLSLAYDEYNCGGSGGAGVVCSICSNGKIDTFLQIKVVFLDISTCLYEINATLIIDGTFVYSNKWDFSDGQVACRELGYTSLIYVKETDMNSSDSTGFTEFNCRGDELSLAECVHLETNKTCRNKLAAVECSLSERGFYIDWNQFIILFVQNI